MLINMYRFTSSADLICCAPSGASCGAMMVMLTKVTRCISNSLYFQDAKVSLGEKPRMGAHPPGKKVGGLVKVRFAPFKKFW